MANLNIRNKQDRTYQAIVVGSGASGGWAAKEFGDLGVKTLLLERGRNVEHIKDYPTTNMLPYEFKHRGKLPQKVLDENPIVAKCYAFGEDSEHFFAKDAEQPYIQEKPFDWIRGYQVGGKSLLWARQVQRWSDYDFEGPARDGFAVDWPIRYKDIAPWYSHVEKFAGVSGNRDGIDTLPDGEFLPAYDLNIVEKHFAEKLKETYGGDRHMISSRCAHIHEPRPEFAAQGRASCQNRNLCQRGCPFGGYFSSNSSTIPWALKSGNVTLRPDSVVHSVIYDDEKGKATGVRVIDAHTKEVEEFYADVIFINAAAVNSNAILMNSTSARFPNGLGNDSGVLGKYFAFHNYRAGVSAAYDGFTEYTTSGGRPTSGYIPRFRNVKKQETDFLRGYAGGFSAYRGGGYVADARVGMDLKNSMLNKMPPDGPWRVGSHMMGETIPKESNYIALDKDKLDPYGLPTLQFNVEYDDNDEKMIIDYQEQISEMFSKAGFTDISVRDDHRVPGLDIHEMGGVRMGKDPKTSMLNGNHQLHAVPNVYVTDGASMTSTSTQNPTLTYMAFAARAAHHAVNESKKG
ncbi:choline dehydrogenase-like flavoprotein [Algoriphagus ratkowskyi]|uniref:Choline dehydrogenase-like flavoprotein n=1 Tax=Algoriphagus ratkowskyi TaxID=57028 RepID=A0A2W7RUV3_9BACT|nr:GMC family oxidoreductase [Algoriphagus ratkowskyi]PZX58419.1 choline dehydrogenase-like flavoprotein [Algoriphagus ratkowskyi]TXD77714.1 GMC family oxidoreductase [Algoriphagus ratkowskyi]